MSIAGRSSIRRLKDGAIVVDLHDLAPVGGPEPVVRGEEAVILMPVLPRWRDAVGKPVEEILRREVDDAVLAQGDDLARAAGADPLATLVAGECVANTRPHQMDPPNTVEALHEVALDIAEGADW